MKSAALPTATEVVAYKLGMLISGGLFLSHYSELGWQSGMQLIVLILAMGYLPVLYQLWWRRDAALHHSLRSTSQTQSPSEHKAQSLWRIIKALCAQRACRIGCCC